MIVHVPGRSVSSSTYINHGCRCDGCKAEHAEYMARYRAKSKRNRLQRRGKSIAASRALTAFMAEHPDRWRQMLDEAYAEVGFEPMWRVLKPVTA